MSVFSCGLEYSITDDNKAILCSVGSCTNQHIIVPDTVNGGIPVVAVADKAFFRCRRIKSITLPSSVKIIGASAFAWCSNLKSVELAGVEYIDDRAFMGCNLLKNIFLSEALRFLGEKAFAYCPEVTDIYLPRDLERIGSACFEGCRNLTSILLPQNIKVIENGVFYACSALTNINLPQSLEYIDEYAFAYCISLGDFVLPKHAVINNDAFYECGQYHFSKIS